MWACPYAWSPEKRAVGQLPLLDLMRDFHGHTAAEAKGAVSVAAYEKGSGAQAPGPLTAPIDGIRGWYLRNRSDRPIKVRLKLPGFYELVPAGEEGNLAGLSRPARRTKLRPAGGQCAARQRRLGNPNWLSRARLPFVSAQLLRGLVLASLDVAEISNTNLSA
jgi:hypothetical protein